jgi:hypothetical protein
MFRLPTQKHPRQHLFLFMFQEISKRNEGNHMAAVNQPVSRLPATDVDVITGQYQQNKNKK